MNFESVKKIIAAICWISIILFTFLSILAIWEVIDNNEVIWKSLTSMSIIFCSSLISLYIMNFLGVGKK